MIDLGLAWRFWIDRGGTFTDLVARSPDGELVVRKVLSAAAGGDPVVAAIRELVGVGPGEPLPEGAIAEVRLGTTVATNALLERSGAPTLLLVSHGFADALLIGDQHRPELFALRIVKPDQLHGRVLEVGGRLAADGSELEPLRLDADLEAELRRARADGYHSLAVALLHGARHPRHERALGEWLRQLWFEAVALSHEVSPLTKLVPRAQTAVLEAYVDPPLRAYLGQLQAELGSDCGLRVMQSSGGLIAPEQLRAKDTILSGPAGGLVGACRIAAAAGLGAIVGFDMGGTSTDVFHSAGPGRPWERCSETEIAGLTLQAPMLAIHTVAAGGGSVVHVDGERLQVGPASAGADPGPACYQRGGPATVTDANLLLGRLRPEAFPALFGPGGDQPLEVAASAARFEALAAQLMAGGTTPQPIERLAEGAVEIAVARMAGAIRRISIQRGHDLRQAALVGYGGAGGQHACALAEALGMAQVLLHPLAGVLSAYGMGLAEERRIHERSVLEPLDAACVQRLHALAERLDGEPLPNSSRRVTVWLRLRGAEVSLPVALDALEAMTRSFLGSHQQRYGYTPALVGGTPVALEVEWLSVERVAAGAPLADRAQESGGDPQGPGSSPATAPLFIDGAWRPASLLSRERLRPGDRLKGPALITESTGTVLLAPGWDLQVLAGGELLLRHAPSGPGRAGAHALGASSGDPEAGDPKAVDPKAVDPVLLELFHYRFTAIAEQMGERLRLTSSSVNIRERLDFSCALFDRRGDLVANAPHIPVHLGSMGESVASLLAAVARGERPPLAPGDAVVSNDPYNGGTHLPDLTVITPVFAAAGAKSAEPSFFVASRGHHADVGGLTPGSMPPGSSSIEEEGLLLDNVPFLVQGEFPEAIWRQRLAAGAWPVRNPDQLLADLQAQVAANRLGAAELERLVGLVGRERVLAYMGHGQDNAAEAVRRVIDRLEDGAFRVELDDGAAIAVAVRIDRAARRATVDFSGTSPQHPGNLNAPLAITKAVVLYVFRTLVGEAIPLNAGCFRPLDLLVPEGCLLRPRHPAAVVAGNVETSQAIANALFGALGVMAAAQGTMNNLSFGNGHCQYYETICGGSGAGATFAGADAIQSHMTNSRLTDPEVLESRFPVRLESFQVRRGSGGLGRHRGGDGVVRRLRFLEPLTVSILSGSRRVAPFGLAGGESGALGLNRLERADGSIDALAGSVELEVQPGDLLEIATPGGGGYGA
ncbi:hydantoinase B/oxoprolinase family protein [Cyanobium sp. Morenito 9A2]|uniref:hydantoinase B/oxoprolinase family protein n=1 Tax=Cyanobium sp. Morenito 9A2 TaxID=2823718 RepID=UPI0020CD2481|nr:hydantoinase B/oxoprolinase family protein [Cyanobium sp. Morenito 9A2]MCP9850188.1 hydantoinase B/oxoprolinase family protein [Cyanobium sp. Morenito 9A2]